jgi:hypothetical protein
VAINNTSDVKQSNSSVPSIARVSSEIDPDEFLLDRRRPISSIESSRDSTCCQNPSNSELLILFKTGC